MFVLSKALVIISKKAAWEPSEKMKGVLLVFILNNYSFILKNKNYEKTIFINCSLSNYN